MAHEVAHVRHRHVPWLAVSLVACVGVPAALIDVGARAVADQPGAAGANASLSWAASQLALMAAALATGLTLFGWISRRFEWQADAFAARHLSPESRVTPAAAESMSAALGAVARLNHIPPEQFSWRHGSIRRRRRNLADLVGLPVASLTIDRLAARIKVAVAVAAMTLPLLLFIGP